MSKTIEEVPKEIEELTPTGKPSKMEATEKVVEKWTILDIPKKIGKGWHYRIKTKNDGTRYMTIRHANTERSLGRYTPEREKLLFKMFPRLPFAPSVPKVRAIKQFMSVPIRKVAVIPRDYQPTIDVIRYFHIFKDNGFPGDFSDFINGNVKDHFVRCHGIVLPVLLEETEVQKIEGEN